MNRMSVSFKLRKWSKCMIWAKNNEFCFFFVKFWNFKDWNFHFKARNGLHAPRLVRNDISHMIIKFLFNLFFQYGRLRLSWIWVTCQLVSTRTHVNSYPCQLVPPIDVNSYHKWCQLVPQVMSTRTQQGRYQIMVRADISYHTTDVNSYPCQLVPLIDVNSYHH